MWCPILLSRRPAQAAAADEVQVDMEDGLAGVAVRVEHGPETAGGDPAILRDGGGPPNDFTDDLIIVRRQFVERRDVALRHDEDVRGCLRIDVVEGEQAVVFVDDGRRNLAFDDLAEETVWHVHSLHHGGRVYVRCDMAVRAMPCRSRRAPIIVSSGAPSRSRSISTSWPRPNSNTR